MKTKFFTIVLLAFIGLSSNTNAQSPNWLWAKSAVGSGDECGNSISTDANGNSYITGRFYGSITFGNTTLTNAGGWDIFIVKYDGAGNVLWAKSAGGTGPVIGNSISTDANGNLYITGQFYDTITFGSTMLTSVGGWDIFVVKYDGAGNVLWAKSAGGNKNDYGNSISTDINGNSYITGEFKSNTITIGSTTLTNAGSYSSDIFVVKYDGAGNLLWAKSAGGAGHDYGNSISTDTSGNSYITGSFGSPTITFGSTTLTNTSASHVDLFVVKYDGAGNVLWAKSAGGSLDESSNSIHTDANGNSYITGNFDGSITFGSTTLTYTGSFGNDIFIVKYDGAGNVLWAKSAGGSLDESSNSISTDANGNSYITGRFYSSTITFGSDTLTNAGTDDIFVVKYDGAGNVLWAKSAGGTEDDHGWSISLDANGNSYITGGFASPIITFGSTTLTNAGDWDIFVVKLDNVTGIAEYNEPFNAITVFPNPANGKFTVNSKIKISKIEVINVQGKKVYTSQINTAQSILEGLSTEIDLSNESKGIYFVNIIAGEKTYNSKIIIQ